MVSTGVGKKLDSVVSLEDELDERIFRDAMSRFATGVAVVTTIDEYGAPVGVTINSLTSVSLDPPLVLWTLALRAHSLPAFRRAGAFAVNLLPADSWDVCTRFARAGADKFAGVKWARDPEGLPVLDGALAHLACATWRRYPGGDHEILVGRVRRVSVFEGSPLILFRGKPVLGGESGSMPAAATQAGAAS